MHTLGMENSQSEISGNSCFLGDFWVMGEGFGGISECAIHRRKGGSSFGYR